MSLLSSLLHRCLRPLSRVGSRPLPAARAARRRPGQAARVGAAALVGAALLASCGGSVQQVSKFVPSRLIVLGEETSVLLDSDGSHNARKYGVNGIVDGARNCARLPHVAQVVASYYGLVFDECNTAGHPVKAYNFASAGARTANAWADLRTGSDGTVATVDDQMSAVLTRTGESINQNDLVVFWFGVNDLLEIYRAYARGERTQGEALAEAERRGALAAERVNALLDTGARALVLTAPDMGLSPYAIARLTSADPDDATVAPNSQAQALLSELSRLFNGNLRTRIDGQRFDGRNFGLVFADEAVQAIVANPGNYPVYLASPYNVTVALCVVAQPNCSEAVDSAGVYTDYISGGLTTGYLWASDRWLAYPVQALLANQAVSRLNALPF